MVRYSLLRVLVFFGCLLVLWLLGLRDKDEQVWLLLGSVALSVPISFFVLRPIREQASAEVSRKVEDRLAKRQERRDAGETPVVDRDAAAEDAEDDFR